MMECAAVKVAIVVPGLLANENFTPYTPARRLSISNLVAT